MASTMDSTFDLVTAQHFVMLDHFTYPICLLSNNPISPPTQLPSSLPHLDHKMFYMFNVIYNQLVALLCFYCLCSVILNTYFVGSCQIKKLGIILGRNTLNKWALRKVI